MPTHREVTRCRTDGVVLRSSRRRPLSGNRGGSRSGLTQLFPRARCSTRPAPPSSCLRWPAVRRSGARPQPRRRGGRFCHPPRARTTQGHGSGYYGSPLPMSMRGDGGHRWGIRQKVLLAGQMGRRVCWRRMECRQGSAAAIASVLSQVVFVESAAAAPENTCSNRHRAWGSSRAAPPRSSSGSESVSSSAGRGDAPPHPASPKISAWLTQ